MLTRLRNIIKKEFIQFLRDKHMRITLLVPPILQLIIFGFAANFDLKHIPAAFVDYDKSQESRELVSRFGSTVYFDMKYPTESIRGIEKKIDKGEALIGVVIPAGFSGDLKSGKEAEIQVILDGTDSNSAMVAVGYLNGFLGEFNRAFDKQVNMDVTRQRINVKPRTWYNPNLESRLFFVPGVIALIVFIVTMILTAMAVVKEYEIGTIEQILVTPIRPIELILGKLLPFALVGIVDVVLISIVARLLFQIRIAGNPLVLLVGAVMFLLSSLGLGLFISTISRTQQQALMASFFLINPAVLLSGFGFPIENMPEVVQYLTYLNPLRYFIVVIRGVFLKGLGFSALFGQFMAMALIGLSTITISALRFKQKLE